MKFLLGCLPLLALAGCSEHADDWFLSNAERATTAEGTIAILERSTFRTRPWSVAGERGAETTSKILFGIEFSNDAAGKVSAVANRRWACTDLDACDQFPRRYMFMNGNVVPATEYLRKPTETGTIESFSALWQRPISGLEALVLSPPKDPTTAKTCVRRLIEADQLVLMRPGYWVVFTKDGDVEGGLEGCYKAVLADFDFDALLAEAIGLAPAGSGPHLELCDLIMKDDGPRLIVGRRKEPWGDYDSFAYIDVAARTGQSLRSSGRDSDTESVVQPMTFFGDDGELLLGKITFVPAGGRWSFDLEVVSLTPLARSRQRVTIDAVP